MASAGRPRTRGGRPTKILETIGPGELPRRTEFGSLLYRLRHQKNDTVLQELGRLYVVEALKKWEPRVAITAVQIGREQHNGENVLAIRIRYDVISTNPLGNNVILSSIEQRITI